jgi:C4-dicarboxylate transporter
MRKFLIPDLGVAIGAISGYLYWQQIGCSSATCMITSKPLNSTIYGAVMGYLVFGLIEDLIKKR